MMSLFWASDVDVGFSSLFLFSAVSASSSLFCLNNVTATCRHKDNEASRWWDTSIEAVGPLGWLTIMSAFLYQRHVLYK